MPSLKKNFLYSSILTCANYIFPLLTYPYVSRVLGVENIGVCNFADSIISYFLIFSSMGINSVGIREIAKTNGNLEKLNQTYRSLLTLVLISTTIAAAILLIVTFCVPQLFVHKELMFIGMIRLFASVFQVEWLFKGLEQFKYITQRSIAVKCIYTAMVFCLVKESDDYTIYFGLYAAMVCVNALLNILYSRKFVRFGFCITQVKLYFRSFLTMGVYMILTSMYTTLNVVFLGFVGGEIQVGYYTTATKLYAIFLSLFTAFTGVMLPRMSLLMGEGRIDEFKAIIKKSQSILITFSLPVIIYVEIFASGIVALLSGTGYEGAVFPMRIIFSLLFICGYEQILVIQTLMPLKQDRILLRNSMIGAGFGMVLNFALVPSFLCVGSSLVWVLAELVILALSQKTVYSCLKVGFPLLEIFKGIAKNVPLVVLLFCVRQTVDIGVKSMIYGAVVCVFYMLLVEKEIFLRTFFNRKNTFNRSAS